jgi:hypothetical protein
MILGYVQWHRDNTICVTRESWAPGVWAGTEGAFLDNGAQILAVDLANRTITIGLDRGALAEGYPLRIDAARSYPQALRIQPIADQIMNEAKAYSIVENFSYKPDYNLTITETWNSTALELRLRYSPLVGNHFYIRESINFHSLNYMRESAFKKIIFNMVNELEKDIIIEFLKFDRIQYLSNDQR